MSDDPRLKPLIDESLPPVPLRMSKAEREETERERKRERDRTRYAENRERERERNRARRAAMSDEDRERQREYNRAWRAANPERVRELYRAWRAANPERVRARKREHNRTVRHGISRDQRDALYAAQGEACAGCREPFPNDDLDIDHDHGCCPGPTSCGRCVRGLLCRPCNSRDVLVGRSPARLIQEATG